jgi:hypothetical protein
MMSHCSASWMMHQTAEYADDLDGPRALQRTELNCRPVPGNTDQDEGLVIPLGVMEETTRGWSNKHSTWCGDSI